MAPDELQALCLEARQTFYRWGSIAERMTDLRANVRTPVMLALYLGLNVSAHYDIDLRQGLASPGPLRRCSQAWNDTIHKKAIAGFGISAHKARLLARCHDLYTGRLARRRLHRLTRN